MFSLNDFEESYLGLGGNAYYGFDTVNLGVNGAGLPTLDDQVVAAYGTNDFWLGSLGLSPIPFNISDLNNPLPSMLGTLANRSLVPSSAWAYTAGAHYKDPPVFGSLTLGGYDTTRFIPNNLSFVFGADLSRDLVLGLQTITYNTIGSPPLLTAGINIFIDSMVSHLWLPVSVCQAFEQAFNLTWNATAELYLISEEVHTKLVAQSPAFTFSLGATTSGGETIDIVLPYAAFDLNVSDPIVKGNLRYFPLKRAQNSTQYTLGRVFLQEAYVIADYDRHNFSVSQALFPSTATPQKLVAINAPKADSPTAAHSFFSRGAIAGMVVGSVVVMIVAVGTLWWSWKKLVARRKDKLVPEQPGHEMTGPESTSDQLVYPELDEAATARHEVQALPSELPSNKSYWMRHELEHMNRPLEIHGRELRRIELE